jgi:hypothetical protein
MSTLFLDFFIFYEYVCYVDCSYSFYVKFIDSSHAPLDLSLKGFPITMSWRSLCFSLITLTPIRSFLRFFLSPFLSSFLPHSLLFSLNLFLPSLLPSFLPFFSLSLHLFLPSFLRTYRFGAFQDRSFITLLPTEGTPLSIGGVGPGCLIDPNQPNTMKKPSKYILIILSNQSLAQFRKQVSEVTGF